MNGDAELRERLRRYYTAYYRDALGIPDWAALVATREHEEVQEVGRLARLGRLVGEERLRGRVLNVGCGTGGFDAVVAAAGARTVGVDTDAEAIAVSRLRRAPGSRLARALSEALPFRAGTFDFVHCFSVIEHVASVEASIREMVRVTRSGGAIYVHTPNAWSLWEGHYKLPWIPFLPRPLGALYLRLRGRPTAYLRTFRRLTLRRLLGAFRAAGVTAVAVGGGDSAWEARGRLRALTRGYYRLFGVVPFLELVAVKP